VARRGGWGSLSMPDSYSLCPVIQAFEHFNYKSESPIALVCWALCIILKHMHAVQYVAPESISIYNVELRVESFWLNASVSFINVFCVLIIYVD
jgi:hypothetical protein